MRKVVQQRMVGGREEYKAIYSYSLLIPELVSCNGGTVVGCKCLQVSLTEVDMTIPSPDLSHSERSEGRLESGLATESELSDRCQLAGEDMAVCRSSASSKAALCTAPSVTENTDNMHSQSHVYATNLNLQQSEIGTDTWSVGIDDLPDEILIKIFSHMSFCELVDVVQKVNSRWRRLSQDLELWADKEYHIRYWNSCDSGNSKSGISDQEAIQTFCDAPNLRKVTMERGAKSCLFRALSNRCYGLSELRLHMTQKLSYSVLKNLVEKCSSIHTLRISNELLKLEKFSEAVSRLHHLRMLELDVHNSETVPVLQPLGDGCPRLEEVDFGNMTVDLDDLRYFLNGKRNNLKSIKIKWAMTGKRCVVPLLTICADSLESLQLSYYEVVRGEAREAFTALGSLKNLRELKMMIDDVPPPPRTIALAFNTGGLSKLRRLDLRDGFGLDDDTIITISRWCPALRALVVRSAERLSDAAFSQIYRLKHLEMLDVSDCRGLRGALIPYITRLTRLRSLTMEELEFPKFQPGLSSIVELSSLRCLTLDNSLVTGVPFDTFPGKLVSLRELNIQWCRGDPEATAGLTGQMPNLEIRGSIKKEDSPFNSEYESDAELTEEDNGENADEENEDDAEEANGYYAEEENGVNEGLSDAEEENGENAGPDDTDEAQYCNCGIDGDSDSDSDNESDNNSDLCNISILFPEDI